MDDAAVLIGRFQPVHNGHLALLRAALARAQQVIVVLGSAHQARTPKNPFTWQERAQMLREALSNDEQKRLLVLPVRDYYDEPRWAQAVQQAVRQALAAHCAAGAHIALVGHFKDDSSAYLRAFPDWPLLALPRQGGMDASQIRHAYWAATPDTIAQALAPLGPEIPPTTLAWLHAFAQRPEFAALQHEWRILCAYRQSWAGAPYPPVFVTVDALLRCQDQVLLVQRGRAPGRGLWALPGGFVEPQDTLWQSCLRELQEETAWPLPEPTMRAALQQVRVFDHPGRSQRGRTITHVHCFDLGSTPLPRVCGGDDAVQAQWMPIAALAGMEELFFEDHFHILRQCLALA